jgi:hypothetical protein
MVVVGLEDKGNIPVEASPWVGERAQAENWDGVCFRARCPRQGPGLSGHGLMTCKGNGGNYSCLGIAEELRCQLGIGDLRRAHKQGGHRCPRQGM